MSGRFCNTVLENDSSFVHESSAVLRLQESEEHKGIDREIDSHGERKLLSAREFGKYLFKAEVCELANPKCSSTVGFREHLLPLSAAVMLLARLVLVRFSVFFAPC